MFLLDDENLLDRKGIIIFNFYWEKLGFMKG